MASKKGIKLLKTANKFCFLFYFCGIGLFVFFNHEEQSERCYFSENALLPGLVQLQHSSTENEMLALSNKCILKGNGSAQELKILLQELGLESYEQKFQFQKDFVMTKDMINGTNVYGIIRAARSASTECIVINVPLVENNLNYASGVALTFGKLALHELFWAKDIVILFSQHGIHGVRAWLDAYHGMTSFHIEADELPARAGSIQAAVILELSEQAVSYINLRLEGHNGQLPNLDLVNLVVKLSRSGRIPISINHEFEPRSSSQFENLKQYLASSWGMMKRLATGKSSGNHGEFLIYNAPALSIEGVRNEQWVAARSVSFEKLLNGICRSLNSLLERFHQSFFFYFLPSIDRYISISMFMPCFGLVLLPAVIKALLILLDFSSTLDDGAKNEKDDKVLDELLSKSGSSFADSDKKSNASPPAWYEVLSILTITYICGIMLFYSPHFTEVWSEMFEISPERSFALLHLFVFVAGTMFIYSFEISLQAAAAIRIVSLLLISIMLGTLAIINFSFGYVAAVFIVPPSLLISHQPGKFYYLNKLIALLASPAAVSFLLFKTLNDYVDIYNWHLTSQSLFYALSTLLFFPHWLQLWAVTNGTREQKIQTMLSEKKEQ